MGVCLSCACLVMSGQGLMEGMEETEAMSSSKVSKAYLLTAYYWGETCSGNLYQLMASISVSHRLFLLELEDSQPMNSILRNSGLLLTLNYVCM